MRISVVTLGALALCAAMPAAGGNGPSPGREPLASAAVFNSLSGFTDLTQNNTVTVTFTVSGTVNDGGGNDSVQIAILDDNVLKVAKTYQIPVGTRPTISDTLTWSGPIGASAPGVGVYMLDAPGSTVLASVDPLFLTGELPLSVSKSAAASIAPGQDLTYTLVYGNTTSGPISGVVVQDRVPSGTSFVSASGGGVLSAGTVTWNLGTVPAKTTGLTVQLTVRVTALSGLVTNATYSIAATGITARAGAPVVTTVNPVTPTPTVPPTATPTPTPPCAAPGAPGSPRIAARFNPGATPSGTDHLTLAWDRPAAGQTPEGYRYALNGGPESKTSSTSVDVPPSGAAGTLRLSVRAYACGETRFSDPATSAAYSVVAPVADFEARSLGARQFQFTDRSQNGATRYLWLFNDGPPVLDSSGVTHTFADDGSHSVSLIATNGAGSGSVTKTVVVSAAAAREPRAQTSRQLDDADPYRQTARGAWIRGTRRTALVVRLDGARGEPAVLYLRLLARDGSVRHEQQLLVPEGEETSLDLRAFRVGGEVDVELVGFRPFRAWLVEEEREKPGVEDLP